MKIRKIIVILLLLFACTEEAPRQTLPVAPVYFRIELNGMDNQLNGGLSAIVYTEKNRRTPQDQFGYGGLLVVRDAQASTLFVYDAACPYERDAKVCLIPNDKGEAMCPACHSEYITMYGKGDVKTGVSKSQLQKYRAIPQTNNGEFLLIN